MLNDFLGYDDIKTMFIQIIDEFKEQQKVIDQISDSNKLILQDLEKIDQEVSSLLIEEMNKAGSNGDDIDGENRINDNDDNDHGSFNMKNQTIIFESEIYEYNKEIMCSDKDALNNILDLINQRKNIDCFPQGILYCESLLKQQQQSQQSTIILICTSKDQFAWFCFPLLNYDDLMPDNGYRANGNKLFTKHIKEFDEYKDDIYPQGREYCHKLLKEQSKKGSLYILARKGEEHWTRYYFKLDEFIPINQGEELYLSSGRNQLKNDLNLIRSSPPNMFPQGVEYCINLYNQQLENNGQVLAIGNNNKWIYYPKEKIKSACNMECWSSGSQTLNREINVLNARMKKKINIFPQGAENCKKILMELSKNDGTVNILVRQSTFNYWFYFKK
ncbi:hypothetical protein M9Y10_003784 [Tritrichomonas musculus]|uniref:t-SNARE coiled-coil homology domain-containing protein n=1 Tax=Tritrichomonas musculus TaxID=1915356 RepID=A0ABR2JS63_9EUKA